MPLKNTDTKEANSGVLYIVATPIGNLNDITQRALETLKIADRICAEDTRNTRKLLTHFGIQGDLQALHDHMNAVAELEYVCGLPYGALDAGKAQHEGQADE